MKYQNIAINILQRQYIHTNVAKLCIEKANIYDNIVGDLASVFNKEILNIDTCNTSALENYWGKIFKITRSFKNKNTGEVYNLDDDELREVIHLRSFATTWSGDLASLNLFLYNLFKKRGQCYVIDALNMTTLIFSFDFNLKEWEEYLFRYTDLLPRPAGVGSEISIIEDKNKYFGFNQYNQIIISPITVGFKTYTQSPMGEGELLTYNKHI